MTALPPPSKVKLGLVIDLDTCVGCHACAVACKEWNDRGQFGPLVDEDARGREPLGVWVNRVHSYEVDVIGAKGVGADAPPTTARDAGTSGVPTTAREAGTSGVPTTARDTTAARAVAMTTMTVHFPRSCLHCEVPDCVTVCPTGASYKRAEDGIVLVDEDLCIGCKLCSWACPYGAREYSEVKGTMQKCTLCVDRIYNETLDPRDRQPACVAACPTRARHFGDLGDPSSAVSRLVAERGGYDLAPEEFGYKPVNKYLPPRPRQCGTSGETAAPREEPYDASALSPLLRWVDRVLSR